MLSWPQHHIPAGRRAIPVPAMSQATREAKITETLSKPAALSCYCDIRADMTDDELMALGGGCTSPQFTCPTLDRVRRVVKAYDKKEDDIV